MNFDSDVNLTTTEYYEMVNDNFNRNQCMMNDFEKYGFSIKGNVYYGANDRSEHKASSSNDFLEYSECEALIKNINRDRSFSDTVDDDIIRNASTNKMCLLNININPNSIDYDIESEIKLWCWESDSINKDKTLDNKSKFSSLPKRNIKIKLSDSDEYYILENCKIIENMSNKEFPLNFMLAIERITRLQ